MAWHALHCLVVESGGDSYQVIPNRSVGSEGEKGIPLEPQG